MPKHGKKYREAIKLVDEEKLYQVAEAIPLLRKLNYVTFDPTVELHMQLGVDPRHADQMVRGTAGLPAGTGKSVKVLVFAQGEKATEAEQAGADFVGLDDMIKQINEGWLGFDVANSPLSEYRWRSFYSMRNDALDRLGTRIEHRMTRAQIGLMMERAGLSEIRFSESAPFWCAVGRRI